MPDTQTNATGERIAGREDTPAVNVSPGRRLIGISQVCPHKVPLSKRGWLRLCDSGRAPWGRKLGARRVWDAQEIDEWIAGGCKPVRTPKGGRLT